MGSYFRRKQDALHGVGWKDPAAEPWRGKCLKGGSGLAKFERHLFVCTNARDESAPRPSCLPRGAKELKDAFKDAVKAVGLKSRVRANESGCLDQCEHGPVVVVYPEAIWYGFVQISDVGEIVKDHLIGGHPVERLRIKESCLNTVECPHRKGTG